jgi:PleD family two-component response regulator
MKMGAAPRRIKHDGFPHPRPLSRLRARGDSRHAVACFPVNITHTKEFIMSEKARILFVDDEERIVNLLKIMFRGIYEVFTATNGHQALQIVAANRIHVIVSDQRMPEMLGIDLLSKVRELSPTRCVYCSLVIPI